MTWWWLSFADSVISMPARIGPPPVGYENRLLTMAEARAMQALWTPDEPGVETLGERAAAGNRIAMELVGEELVS